MFMQGNSCHSSCRVYTQKYSQLAGYFAATFMQGNSCHSSCRVYPQMYSQLAGYFAATFMQGNSCHSSCRVYTQKYSQLAVVTAVLCYICPLTEECGCVGNTIYPKLDFKSMMQTIKTSGPWNLRPGAVPRDTKQAYVIVNDNQTQACNLNKAMSKIQLDYYQREIKSIIRWSKSFWYTF